MSYQSQYTGTQIDNGITNIGQVYDGSSFKFPGGGTGLLKSTEGVISQAVAGEDYISSSQLVDYIVDENILSASTSNSWSWRKWNSGVSECWGRWNESGTASSLSGTNVYYLTGAEKTLPTDLFLPLPVAFCQAALSVYGLPSLRSTNLTATTIQPTYVLLSNNGGQTIIGYAYIYLIGRWK